MKHANIVTYNTILFLPKKFCGPTTRAPRSSGPRFVEPPEPLVSTPLQKEAHIQYTKKKAIHRNKTIKSIKHLHIIAAKIKMFPKIFFDQIFRRRNEIELTVDSVFLKCSNDIVFTTIFSKCMKSQIITIEHSQPEDDSTLINK